MRIAVWIVVALMIWASPMIANGREKLTAITGDGEFTLGAPPPDMEALGFKPSLLSDPPGQTTWFRSEESPRYPGQVGSERMVVVIDGVIDRMGFIIWTDLRGEGPRLYGWGRSTLVFSMYDIKLLERNDDQATILRDDDGRYLALTHDDYGITVVFGRKPLQD